MPDSEKPYKIDFGTSFGIAAYTRGFEKQADFLAAVDIAALPERLKKCGILLACITEDCKAICLLVSQGYSNQAYMVFRAFLEKIVTLLYLQVVSDEVFEDYMRYPLHKAYTKVKTMFTVETRSGPLSFGFPGEIDLSAYPDMEAAKKRFTSASGKPLTRWNNTSIESKLSTIKQAGLLDTALLELMVRFIYDDASEAMHATLYGSVFQYGVFSSTKRPPDIDQEVKDHLFAHMWMGGAVIFQLNEWLFGITGQKEVLDEARDISNLLTEHLKRAVRTPSTDTST